MLIVEQTRFEQASSSGSRWSSRSKVETARSRDHGYVPEPTDRGHPLCPRHHVSVARRGVVASFVSHLSTRATVRLGSSFSGCLCLWTHRCAFPCDSHTYVFPCASPPNEAHAFFLCLQMLTIGSQLHPAHSSSGPRFFARCHSFTRHSDHSHTAIHQTCYFLVASRSSWVLRFARMNATLCVGCCPHRRPSAGDVHLIQIEVDQGWTAWCAVLLRGGDYGPLQVAGETCLLRPARLQPRLADQHAFRSGLEWRWKASVS